MLTFMKFFILTFFVMICYVNADCINANEFVHCDITKRSNSCETCLVDLGADYSWVQQYFAYYVSGTCDQLVMTINGNSMNPMYLYNLYNNETINICSERMSGGDTVEFKVSVDNYDAITGSDDCQIGVNLFIGTPIDNLCNN